MTENEIKILKNLDELCETFYLSYKIEVDMGIGTRVTIYFCNDTELVFGGLDFNFNTAIRDAIESLSKLKSKTTKEIK